MTRDRDPARAELMLVLDSVDQRIEAARESIVRCVCGGAGWNGERTQKFRRDLERARVDQDAVLQALQALEQLDSEIDGGSK